MQYDIKTLEDVLGSHLLGSRTSDMPIEFGGVLILESPELFQPQFLCIAEWNIFLAILESPASLPPEGCIVVADGRPFPEDFLCPSGLTVLNTDLASIPLSNLLNQWICQSGLSEMQLLFSIQKSEGRDESSPSLTYQQLLPRILSDSGESDEMLLTLLHRLSPSVKPYMRLIIIHSQFFSGNDGERASKELFAAVCSYFPKDHIARNSGDILVLQSSESSHFPLSFEIEEFEHFLDQHAAVAMIANPFTSIMTMRVMYRQCVRMFPIAMAVRLDDEIRCFTFARYTQYNVINICDHAVGEVLGRDDLMYLCHPGVLTITRYDRAHGTNLRDIMFHYLMNDRSIARTSARLFLHRNTTIYKIKKIEELLGETMDDPYLRHNLVFSCLLMRYREQYQRIGIPLATIKES